MGVQKIFVASEGLLFEAREDYPGPCASDMVNSVHQLRCEGSVLPYYFDSECALIPPLPSGKRRLFTPHPAQSMAELSAYTQWFVFAGVGPNLQLHDFIKYGIICIFEPCRERMDAFLAQIPLSLLAKKRILFFSGNIHDFSEPLRYIIPPNLTELGMPAFYVQEGLNESYTQDMQLSLEICFYYHQLYPHEQIKNRQISSRPVAGGFTHAQQVHLFENLTILHQNNTVESLRGLCTGAPALLVAAGEGLEWQLPHIKVLQTQCVVIAASKVAKKLVENGIVPDFVVLQDSSDISARELENIPDCAHINLVSHLLAGAARGKFAKIFFYGLELEDLNLPTHAAPHGGSVINYQFYLATLLGCSTLITSGVSLCTTVGKGAGYVNAVRSVDIANTTWTCPVRFPKFEEPLYTNLNFYDVAHWLQTYVQKEQLQVVNMTKNSLLFGPTITYDPAPVLNTKAFVRPLCIQPASYSPDTQLAISNAITAYSSYWQSIVCQIEAVRTSDCVKDAFMELLTVLDRNGTTALLESNPEFRKHGMTLETNLLHGTEQESNAAIDCWLMILNADADVFLKILNEHYEKGAQLVEIGGAVSV